MKKLKFKTNINCSGCIAKFTPHIAGKEGVQTWAVDTTTADKVLTVEGHLTKEEILDLVTTAGFQAREIAG